MRQREHYLPGCFIPPATAPSSPKHKIKAPVPARSEVPVMGLMSDKNWVVANAVEAIASRPVQRVSGTAARPGKQPEINYTQRPGFGKVGVRARCNVVHVQQSITIFCSRLKASGSGTQVSLHACYYEQPMEPGPPRTPWRSGAHVLAAQQGGHRGRAAADRDIPAHAGRYGEWACVAAGRLCSCCTQTPLVQQAMHTRTLHDNYANKPVAL